MFIVREIFHLQFGRYREAKQLVKEAVEKHLLSQPPGSRVLTDFTGEGYRLIMELPYETLADYETDLNKELAKSAGKNGMSGLRHWCVFLSAKFLSR